MFASIDATAERIRAIGFRAPRDLQTVLSQSGLNASVRSEDSHDLILSLLEGHDALAKQLYSAISTANAEGDYVTADLLTKQLVSHEKAAWMLTSLLG